MLNKIKRFLYRLIYPIKKIIIFESNPDFADNTYWLFKYFADNNLFSDYKFVWFISDSKNERKTLCNREIICVDRFDKSSKSIRKKLKYQYSAKIIIDCNRTIFKVRKNQIRIYLGHGMPIKKMDKCFNNKARGECDLLPIIGEYFKNIYEGFGYKSELMVCGYPRNEILTKVFPKKDNKYIIWMPTYRQHRIKSFYAGYENTFPLGIPAIKSKEELYLLDDFLGQNDIKLYFRPHPAQDLSTLELSKMKNICIANDKYLEDNQISLYEFVAKSTALITDYSSIYYDYLLTNRPIGLNFEDSVAYAQNYGLWYNNIRKELPGFLIDNLKDMLLFVESVAADTDLYFEKRRNIAAKYGINEFSSCEIISGFLKEKLRKS